MEFKDKHGANLIVESNKNNIIFKTNDDNIENDYFVYLYFEEDTFKNLLQNLESISKSVWPNFSPKEATDLTSDYEEYYDKKYDAEGELSVKYHSMCIGRPSKDCPYMYKFNKRRMESFIFDALGFK